MGRRKALMGTVIRAELSRKNPYWIEKHRYYELKHFCLQYSTWKKMYMAMDGLNAHKSELGVPIGILNDPTAKCAMEKAFYSDRMNMIKRVAEETEPILASYILKAVIEGWSYDILKARLEIPCGKSTYYELYRKFFWILDEERK